MGKLKTPFWKDAAAHYLTRIKRWRHLEYTEVRDGDAALPSDQRNALEGRRIIDALSPQDVALVLDERGQKLSSPELAALLRRRRIPSTLYLGVAKSAEPPQDLTAHAWVRCGEHPITGGDGQRRFTVLSTFAAHD